MNTLLVTLVAALAFLTGIALHYLLSLRRSLKSYERELADLKRLTGAARGVQSEASEPWIRMVVEVKNPIELAHRESPMAKLASGTAPNLVIKKVYEQVVAQTKTQLKSKNVEAEVSLIVL